IHDDVHTRFECFVDGVGTIDILLEPNVLDPFANGLVHHTNGCGPVDEDMHDVNGERDFSQSPKRPVAADRLAAKIHRDDVHPEFGFQKGCDRFGDTVGAVGESHDGPGGTGSTKERFNELWIIRGLWTIRKLSHAPTIKL